MRSYGEEISFTTGPAIPLTYQDCEFIPKNEVYAQISRSLMKYAEIYDEDNLVRLMIRVYMDGKKMYRPSLSSEERDSTLYSIMKAGFSEIEPITARAIRNRKRSYPRHIQALKPSRTELKPFLVADTETILIDNEHKPYAVGLLLVRPGKEIKNQLIDTDFSEDHSLILDSFEKGVLRILAIQRKISFHYLLHNFSRFDGIFLLMHLACHHKSYKLKPLVRNHRLYEIAVYSGKKKLFCFRDSLNLLQANLAT
ncbi:hypothetical protein IEQ34_023942 [Dendrobium chrysotoxum]|uniref:DNA-directed DNA polymerase n=1 Tax=Dendrobium chrysotoxum TaxID=161865 RepID=A0AAV7FV60_DENCH|nr:hypothetical protein IEQ34_023942 [Dendrobium chrysotoxum]